MINFRNIFALSFLLVAWVLELCAAEGSAVAAPATQRQLGEGFRWRRAVVVEQYNDFDLELTGAIWDDQNEMARIEKALTRLLTGKYTNRNLALARIGVFYTVNNQPPIRYKSVWVKISTHQREDKIDIFSSGDPGKPSKNPATPVQGSESGIFAAARTAARTHGFTINSIQTNDISNTENANIYNFRFVYPHSTNVNPFGPGLQIVLDDSAIKNSLTDSVNGLFCHNTAQDNFGFANFPSISEQAKEDILTKLTHSVANEGTSVTMHSEQVLMYFLREGFQRDPQQVIKDNLQRLKSIITNPVEGVQRSVKIHKVVLLIHSSRDCCKNCARTISQSVRTISQKIREYGQSDNTIQIRDPVPLVIVSSRRNYISTSVNEPNPNRRAHAGHDGHAGELATITIDQIDQSYIIEMNSPDRRVAHVTLAEPLPTLDDHFAPLPYGTSPIHP